jgi:hypothetical protein
MENNYCEFASLIGHEALFHGKLLRAWPGHHYEGEDDRGLPICFVSDYDDDVYIFEDL